MSEISGHGICEIVKNENLKKKRLDELENFLPKHNYPKALVINVICKASCKNVEELRNQNLNLTTKSYC